VQLQVLARLQCGYTAACNDVVPDQQSIGCKLEAARCNCMQDSSRTRSTARLHATTSSLINSRSTARLHATTSSLIMQQSIDCTAACNDVVPEDCTQHPPVRFMPPATTASWQAASAVHIEISVAAHTARMPPRSTSHCRHSLHARRPSSTSIGPLTSTKQCAQLTAFDRQVVSCLLDRGTSGTRVCG
jgi:hypothetical protein